MRNNNKLVIYIMLYDLTITSNYKLWDIYSLIKESTDPNCKMKFSFDATTKEKTNALFFVLDSFVNNPHKMMKKLPFYGLPVILTHLNETGLLTLSPKAKKLLFKNPYSLSDKSRELLEKEFISNLNHLA
jgi:hypothetical protein